MSKQFYVYLLPEDRGLSGLHAEVAARRFAHLNFGFARPVSGEAGITYLQKCPDAEGGGSPS